MSPHNRVIRVYYRGPEALIPVLAALGEGPSGPIQIGTERICCPDWQEAHPKVKLPGVDGPLQREADPVQTAHWHAVRADIGLVFMGPAYTTPELLTLRLACPRVIGILGEPHPMITPYFDCIVQPNSEILTMLLHALAQEIRSSEATGQAQQEVRTTE